MTTYLSNYANFKSKEEMDKASNQHISSNWNQLNKTDRAVLDMIRRYSVKHGAAHLKHVTIAKGVEKSVSTIRRSLKKLETLSIIENIKFKRLIMNGIGANIYSILPFKTQNEQGRVNTETAAEKTIAPTVEVAKTENEPFSFKSKYLKDIKTYPKESYNVTQTHYSRFKNLLEQTLGNDSNASKIYGVYRSLSIRYLKFEIYEDKQDLFDSLSIQALKISLQATKKKTINNLTGFFSSTYKNLIAKHIIGIDDRIKSSSEPIEWFIPSHIQS